jgi:hypothetical protein
LAAVLTNFNLTRITRDSPSSGLFGNGEREHNVIAVGSLGDLGRALVKVERAKVARVSADDILYGASLGCWYEPLLIRVKTEAYRIFTNELIKK